MTSEFSKRVTRLHELSKMTVQDQDEGDALIFGPQPEKRLRVKLPPPEIRKRPNAKSCSQAKRPSSTMGQSIKESKAAVMAERMKAVAASGFDLTCLRRPPVPGMDEPVASVNGPGRPKPNHTDRPFETEPLDVDHEADVVVIADDEPAATLDSRKAEKVEPVGSGEEPVGSSEEPVEAAPVASDSGPVEGSTAATDDANSMIGRHHSSNDDVEVVESKAEVDAGAVDASAAGATAGGSAHLKEEVKLEPYEVESHVEDLKQFYTERGDKLPATVLGKVTKKDEKKPVPEDVGLKMHWQIVAADPHDFESWTLLLHHVEYKNGRIDEIRQAFRGFLYRFPYCFGYWKKFADLEAKKGFSERAEDVYKEGLRCIPLSVDLWVAYITHYRNMYRLDARKGEHVVRGIYERALSACGMDFRSDKLWQSYIDYESELGELRKVTALYDRLIQTPTQLYNHHFENFRTQVASTLPKDILSEEEFDKLRIEVLQENRHLQQQMDSVQIGPPVLDTRNMDASQAQEMRFREQERELLLACGQVPQTDSSSNREETMLIRVKIIERRQAIYDRNVERVSKIWHFEEAIKRPYFHVKKLDRRQLLNWKRYLNAEMNEAAASRDYTRLLFLFERCLIACARYEQFWLKYAHLMIEDLHNIEEARSILRRAQLHLPKKVSLYFARASFEQRFGTTEAALQVIEQLLGVWPDLLCGIVEQFTLLRRLGRHDEAANILRLKLDYGPAKLKPFYAIKLSRYLQLVKGDLVGATQVMKRALRDCPNCQQLWIRLLDLEATRCAADRRHQSGDDAAVPSTVVSHYRPGDLNTDLEQLRTFSMASSRDTTVLQPPAALCETSTGSAQKSDSAISACQRGIGAISFSLAATPSLPGSGSSTSDAVNTSGSANNVQIMRSQPPTTGGVSTAVDRQPDSMALPTIRADAVDLSTWHTEVSTDASNTRSSSPEIQVLPESSVNDSSATEVVVRQEVVDVEEVAEINEQPIVDDDVLRNESDSDDNDDDVAGKSTEQQFDSSSRGEGSFELLLELCLGFGSDEAYKSMNMMRPQLTIVERQEVLARFRQFAHDASLSQQLPWRIFNWEQQLQRCIDDETSEARRKRIDEQLRRKQDVVGRALLNLQINEEESLKSRLLKQNTCCVPNRVADKTTETGDTKRELQPEQLQRAHPYALEWATYLWQK